MLADCVYTRIGTMNLFQIRILIEHFVEVLTLYCNIQKVNFGH